MRVVVVGASSGLGRCIGVGLARGGEAVALLARRKERLEDAVGETGGEAVAIECDVTDEASVSAAIGEAAEALGGIDAVVYTPGIGPLARLEDTDAATWRSVFDTNVTGASSVTRAALPFLREGNGRMIYLSSISASMTSPWPGLGAYVVSKAALDKLVEAWRTEHPDIGFTRLTVGDCAGGEGDSMTGFANDWDMELLMELHPVWAERQLLSGSLFEVDELVTAVQALLRLGPSVNAPSLVLAPRAPAPGTEPPPQPSLGDLT